MKPDEIDKIWAAVAVQYTARLIRIRENPTRRRKDDNGGNRDILAYRPGNFEDQSRIEEDVWQGRS